MREERRMAEHVYRPQSSSIVPNKPVDDSIPVSGGPTVATASSGGGSTPAATGGVSKIHGFTQSGKPTETVESRWKRPLHKNGTGATHVRTFTGNLSQQGLEYLDKHINEWLDSHPDAEVKFATLQVGNMPTATGREPALIAQVWI
jgi:hypothetical protein